MYTCVQNINRYIYIKVERNWQEVTQPHTSGVPEHRGMEGKDKFYSAANPENRGCQGVKHGYPVSSPVICICRWDARKSGFA